MIGKAKGQEKVEIIYTKSEDEIRELCGNRRKLIMTDEKLNNLYPNFLSCNKYILPEGEKAKSFYEYQRIMEFLLDNDYNRNDCIISFGGGTVSDIAGFSASTYMRGMHFISIPTTLLAMVDASIGGKNGINFKGKNIIGNFYNPEKIIINKGFLKTLPNLEIKNGMAEIIKIAMIRDKDFFNSLKTSEIEKIIRRAVSLKTEIVEMDERDFGIRHLLNFGHTIGHAIEAKSQFKEKHGFAVAKGMAMITKIAVNNGKTSEESYNSLIDMLNFFNLPANSESEGLFEYIAMDKKIEGDKIKIVYPKEIGRGEIEEISLDKLKKELEKI